MSDNQDFDRNEPQDSGQVPEQPQFGRRIEDEPGYGQPGYGQGYGGLNGEQPGHNQTGQPTTANPTTASPLTATTGMEQQVTAVSRARTVMAKLVTISRVMARPMGSRLMVSRDMANLVMVSPVTAPHTARMPTRVVVERRYSFQVGVARSR